MFRPKIGMADQIRPRYSTAVRQVYVETVLNEIANWLGPAYHSYNTSFIREYSEMTSPATSIENIKLSLLLIV